MATAQATTEEERVDELIASRIEWLEELKFTTYEALKIAKAKGAEGWPVPITHVAAALKSGATHVQAVRMFAE